MQILKHGKPSMVQVPLTFECIGCGCEFIADHTEYKRTHDWNHEAWVDYCETVCPECGTTIIRCHNVLGRLKHYHLEDNDD